jgi:hypothetical protein
MIHIRSSSQLINESPSFVAGIAYVFSALFHKILDSDFFFYVFPPIDAEMFFYSLFYRQSMAIPSSVSVHSVAFHGFVSEDGIFHR